MMETGLKYGDWERKTEIELETAGRGREGSGHEAML